MRSVTFHACSQQYEQIPTRTANRTSVPESYNLLWLGFNAAP
jgi:hypothetical protein